MSYEKGKLYQFNGIEMVEVAPSDTQKLPVTDAAFETVKAVRKAAHELIGLRPELSVCASAMLLAAGQLPNMAQDVKAYGLRIYGGREKQS